MPLPVLFGHHFQIAYVVRQAEAARRLFADRFGMTRWHVMDMIALHGDQSGSRSLSLAWSGDVMVELIEENTDISSIYSGWAPLDESTVRLHHLGFLIPTAEDYAAIVGQLERAGFPAAIAGSFGDQIDFHYADTTATLGHYYELIHLKPAGADFFAQTPHN
jgi:extradiol dioxygenase family protein